MDRSLPDAPRPGRALDPLLDTAPAGFVSFDDAGVIGLANTSLARLVGRTRGEIEGRHIDLLLSVAGRIFYSTHLFPLLRLHGRAEELYVPILHADGSELPVLVNGAARTRDGQTSYELVVMPMRERNRLEDELIAARNAAQEAAAAKDRFLSIVSHELRSPLTGVAGFSDLLLREQTGDLTERQRRYVERIRDAASYQVGLIEDILDFAAIVGERRAMAPAPISVERVVVRAESLLNLRAAEAGHSIERAPVPAPGQVIADAGGVQQILLNLGVNAIKYSPPGTPIAFRIEDASDRVRFSIRDAGPGIAPEDLDRIFQPFVRLDSTRGPGSRHGVGLGLSISRDLARAMGGEISVESALGKGATFTLDLPAA
ncbi:MAG TPA: HAMP domain-containing sensor histidine kinase [Candidatus Limnocylindria bacterium]